jgi:hypothetical protein
MTSTQPATLAEKINGGAAQKLVIKPVAEKKMKQLPAGPLF